jgi:hypothetical protein
LRCGLGCGRRLQPLQFKLSVLQGLDQSLNDDEALGYLPLVPSTNLEAPVRLEFLRSFPECLAQALSKLQLGLASGGIAVGEAVLAEVMNGRQKFLKLIDAERELFEEVGLGSRALLFPCACSCHSREKSLTEGHEPSKKTTGLCLWFRCGAC